MLDFFDVIVTQKQQSKERGKYIMDKFANSKEKFTEFINKHPEISCVGLLTVACLFFLFFGLGFYPLIDVDETRYAVMARDLFNSTDWNSLMLNGVPFLEKPPLYFWFVGASVKLFNSFNPFAVRLPIAIMTSFLVFFTYFIGKRVISRKFGVISAITMLSSAFFLILAHVAIIDMVLTVLMTSAIYFGFLTHFCKEDNKEYYWFLFYLFMGLGFLAKGILALAIPIVIIFTCNLLTKTLKDIFKPINLIPGLIAFFALIIPWHFLMYQKYGFEFINQYFLIHHFGRLMGSEYIGREHPFWYFIPVFLAGFMPWTFVFIGYITNSFKKLSAKYKAAEGNWVNKLSNLVRIENNEQKFILFSAVSFAIIFLVFSSSSTKLPTYILPAFPFAAILMGHFWWTSDEKNENQQLIHNSTMLLAIIFLVVAIGGSLSYYFLPDELKSQMVLMLDFAIIGLYLLGVFLFYRINTKRALSIFAGYILTMIFIITLAVNQIFTFVYNGGENEIVDYSSYCSNNLAKTQLVTFDFAVKPSVLINYHGKVDFVTDPDFKKLDEILAYKKGPTFVIVKNKNFKNDPAYKEKLDKRLKVIQIGDRYSLYVSNPNNDFIAYYY